ncbi:hypothetical protein L5I01_17415 [Gordonia sp. HY442]|uniref:hypothetical protein n=1 Tax=Gordonia zhenghanii TaxID=2911516 RepID=UPI001F32A43C|nr:hypothetical protein [Gordonia zhenghanii]MCF8605136.1 hypothetical protein [Gordonia zhenghanii]
MSDRREREEARREEARARRRVIDECGRCDPSGWIIIAGRAHRCDHGEVVGDA